MPRTNTEICGYEDIPEDIFLITVIFMHGMLYVAKTNFTCARVKNQNAVKVVLPPTNPPHTHNKVWKEDLNNHSNAPPKSSYNNPIDNKIEM